MASAEALVVDNWIKMLKYIWKKKKNSVQWLIDDEIGNYLVAF